MSDSPDPAAILASLGARWSPDFDAYATGKLDITQVRCVLCIAPCQCRYCEVTHENWYYLATGQPRYETCGMRADPATGTCPRGHRQAHAPETGWARCPACGHHAYIVAGIGICATCDGE